MAGIFISYRRDDSAGQARALFKDLSEILGKNAVFMDVDSIALGRDFREVLQEHLATCDLMLVLIGPRWLSAENPVGQRLRRPDDYVRQEIAAALKRKIPVTPVLVQGARVPDQSQLPDDLKDLAYRNGFELSHTRWDSDVRELLQRLGLQPRRPESPSSVRWRLWAGGVAAILAVALLLWAAGPAQWFDGGSTSKGEVPTAAPSSTPKNPETDSRQPVGLAEAPALELEYAVGAGEVFLEIDVGNGQVGSSRVNVGGQVISSNSQSKFNLGRGDTLRGKVLSVATVVTDVSIATNNIGVRYKLNGGPDHFSWTVSNPSTTEGSSRTFHTSVRLLTSSKVSPPGNCTAFYGTYDMTLTLSSGPASCGSSLGSRWTFSGNADCSNFTVFETGSNITFRGTIKSDGRFKATSSGATIEGNAIGNQITGTDANPTCTFTVSGHR